MPSSWHVWPLTPTDASAALAPGESRPAIATSNSSWWPSAKTPSPMIDWSSHSGSGHCASPQVIPDPPQVSFVSVAAASGCPLSSWKMCQP